MITMTCKTKRNVLLLPQLPGHPLLRKPEILSGFLQQLLAKSHDENAGVRLLGVRGLGNLAEEAPQEVGQGVIQGGACKEKRCVCMLGLSCVAAKALPSLC